MELSAAIVRHFLLLVALLAPMELLFPAQKNQRPLRRRQPAPIWSTSRSIRLSSPLAPTLLLALLAARRSSASSPAWRSCAQPLGPAARRDLRPRGAARLLGPPPLARPAVAVALSRRPSLQHRARFSGGAPTAPARSRLDARRRQSAGAAPRFRRRRDRDLHPRAEALHRVPARQRARRLRPLRRLVWRRRSSTTGTTTRTRAATSPARCRGSIGCSAPIDCPTAFPKTTAATSRCLPVGRACSCIRLQRALQLHRSRLPLALLPLRRALSNPPDHRRRARAGTATADRDCRACKINAPAISDKIAIATSGDLHVSAFTQLLRRPECARSRCRCAA